MKYNEKNSKKQNDRLKKNTPNTNLFKIHRDDTNMDYVA